MPKALIITYYFPPLGGGGTQRTLKFVRYLPEYGWEPYVLTVEDAHHLAQDESLLSEIPEELSVTRTRAFLPARFFRKATNHHPESLSLEKSIVRQMFDFLKKLFYTVIFIPDEFIGWVPFAVRTGKHLIKKHELDVIYSSGPPNTAHLIACRLAEQTGKPWIADLRDLWDQYPLSYNPFEWKWRRSIDDLLERRTLTRANHVIAVSEHMRTQLLQKLPALSPQNVSVITNGFDPSDFDGIEPIKNESRFTIVHSGTLFSWRRLQLFLAAMKVALQQEPALKKFLSLKLIGIVPTDDQQAIVDFGLSKYVSILGYLPYKNSLAHILGADALLLIVGNIPHAANMLTSKLFDYLGANRPIIALGPAGMVRDIVRQEKLGVTLDENDVEGIAENLVNMFEQKLNGGIRHSASSHKKYQRPALTQKLANIMYACELKS